MNKDAGQSYSMAGTGGSPGEITSSGRKNARLESVNIDVTGVSESESVRVTALASSADQSGIARLGEGLRLFHHGIHNNEEGHMGELRSSEPKGGPWDRALLIPPPTPLFSLVLPLTQ